MNFKALPPEPEGACHIFSLRRKLDANVVSDCRHEAIGDTRVEAWLQFLLKMLENPHSRGSQDIRDLVKILQDDGAETKTISGNLVDAIQTLYHHKSGRHACEKYIAWKDFDHENRGD